MYRIFFEVPDHVLHPVAKVDQEADPVLPVVARRDDKVEEDGDAHAKVEGERGQDEGGERRVEDAEELLMRFRSMFIYLFFC